MIPTAVPWGFFYIYIYNWGLGQHIPPIWKSCFAKFNFIKLSIHQDPKNNLIVPFKIHLFARFSLVSLSIHPFSR